MTIKEAIQTRADLAKMKWNASVNYEYGKMVWPAIVKSAEVAEVKMMADYIIAEKEKSDENIFYSIVGEVAAPIIKESGLRGAALGIAVIGALYDRLT